tara:strand:+ start:5135 stop:5395 length:261 start_codon:yes stop_codon:yes gene_type:complete
MNGPVTIPEWESYIETLPREKLWSQCRAVNTFTFARTLITEGMTMGQLETVVKLFARRMVEMEIKLPEGGAFDLHALVQKDPLSAF